MRRLLTGLVVAATTTLIPMLAWAGNQETADQIAQRLRGTNQLTGVTVRYQDGIATLSGRVATEDQRDTALKLTSQVPGVTRVVSELAVGGSDANPLRNSQTAATKPALAQRLESAVASQSEAKQNAAASQAQRVPNSFAATPAAKVSAEETIYEPNQVPSQTARPLAMSRQTVARPVSQQGQAAANNGAPLPMYAGSPNANAQVRYDQPCLPNYAWPSYAAYPNYAAVTYPKQYSATAWPYIGPFYPYPQVPLGWRKVSLQWSDGWWFLDFKDVPASCWQR
jgi:hypothetical protein